MNTLNRKPLAVQQAHQDMRVGETRFFSSNGDEVSFDKFRQLTNKFLQGVGPKPIRYTRKA